MDIVGIIYLIAMSLIAITSTVLGFFLKKQVEAYKEILSETYRQDTTVLKYCITHIFNESIEKEDYERAQKCKDLLSELNNLTKLK